MLRKAYTAFFYHFVWATCERLPLIEPEMERELYRSIEAEVAKMGGETLAVGGMEDHVHLVVCLPSKLAPCRLMQQVKGVSSQVGRELRGRDTLFRWQHGYGAFSLSRPHVARAVAYVNRQKEHHSHEKLWHEWERCDQPAE